jgi:hypothetical protein
LLFVYLGAAKPCALIALRRRLSGSSALPAPLGKISLTLGFRRDARWASSLAVSFGMIGIGALLLRLFGSVVIPFQIERATRQLALTIILPEHPAEFASRCTGESRSSNERGRRLWDCVDHRENLFERISVCLVRLSNLGQKCFANGTCALVIALLSGQAGRSRRGNSRCASEN